MSGFLLGLVPDWLKFVLTHWEWLLAAFLSGVVVGALLGLKRLLVALLVVLTFGLALRWLRPASEPAWETGEPNYRSLQTATDRNWKRRFSPDVGPRGTWQRQNPDTGKWVDE